MNIVGKPVETDVELEAMRVIRNAGREFMTEDKNEISAVEQQVWWSNVTALPTKDFVAIIYRGDRGYGILSRRDDGRLYVSLAVHPLARGFGVGTFIYADMAKRAADEDVYAVVLKSNIASLRAAEKAGYVVDEDGEDRVLLVRRI